MRLKNQLSGANLTSSGTVDQPITAGHIAFTLTLPLRNLPGGGVGPVGGTQNSPTSVTLTPQGPVETGDTFSRQITSTNTGNVKIKTLTVTLGDPGGFKAASMAVRTRRRPTVSVPDETPGPAVMAESTASQ